jgi:hypothetical protein
LSQDETFTWGINMGLSFLIRTGLAMALFVGASNSDVAWTEDSSMWDYRRLYFATKNLKCDEAAEHYDKFLEWRNKSGEEQRRLYYATGRFGFFGRNDYFQILPGEQLAGCYRTQAEALQAANGPADQVAALKEKAIKLYEADALSIDETKEKVKEEIAKKEKSVLRLGLNGLRAELKRLDELQVSLREKNSFYEKGESPLDLLPVLASLDHSGKCEEFKEYETQLYNATNACAKAALKLEKGKRNSSERDRNVNCEALKVGGNRKPHHPYDYKVRIDLGRFNTKESVDYELGLSESDPKVATVKSVTHKIKGNGRKVKDRVVKVTNDDCLRLGAGDSIANPTDQQRLCAQYFPDAKFANVKLADQPATNLCHLRKLSVFSNPTSSDAASTRGTDGDH